ncbi:MAG: polysaccharide deacetylase family protein [Candidatus Krumholzibacteriia bacterium]|nr:polysaccharide deacetylase family protein [Candidatus Latescibacterota bacterium]
MDERRPSSTLAGLERLGLNALARWKHRRRPLILRYAGFRPNDGPSSPGDARLPIAALRAQLGHLKAKGYRFVSLDELLKGLSHVRGSARLVTLSFDGGLRSAIELAYPLLREFGARGTLYVSPALVEAGVTAGGEAAAGWDDLRGLDPAVLLVGNQGRNPLDCEEPTSDAVFERAVWQAGLDIEEKLGYPVRHFCCPAPDERLLPQRIPERLVEYGYRSAVTSHPGFANDGLDAFHLHRFAADADFALFKAATSGALGWLQRLGLWRDAAPTPAVPAPGRTRAAAAGRQGRSGR